MRFNPIFLTALFTCLVLSTGVVRAQDTAAVRLGFVLNFARYVEWPEASLKPDAPLRICLAPGDVSMATQLSELSRQTVQGHAVQTKVLVRPAEAGTCDILYLPAELPTTAATWLSAVSSARALTVSDLPDFTDTGGMIGLVLINGRYRFDINLGNARQADLRISAYLFKLARAVK